MKIANCICIKWGTSYGPEYVNRLKNALQRNFKAKLRFICLTDDPTGIDPGVEIIALQAEPFQERLMAALAKSPRKGQMRKISMFRPGLVPDLEGPLLAFDLDVVIVGPMDDLLTYAPGKVCMRKEWAKPKPGDAIGHGSVLRFDPELHAYLYNRIAADPEGEIEACRGSEQTYTSCNADKAGDFVPYPDRWIVSFKHDCRRMRPLNLFLQPRLPEDARVICFHGNPKMSDAVYGYRSDPLHSTRRCDWLIKHWIGVAAES